MCPRITNSRIAVEKEPGRNDIADFAVGSVLGITYGPDDTFYWHTDESGDGGYHAGSFFVFENPSLTAPSDFGFLGGVFLDPFFHPKERSASLA